MPDTKWNPNFPSSIGLEAQLVRFGNEVIGASREVGVKIKSNYGSDMVGTDDGVQPCIRLEGITTDPEYSQWLFYNVYDLAADPTDFGTVETTTVPVNGGFTNGGITGGGTLVDAVATFNDGRFIDLVSASGHVLDVEFATAGLFTEGEDRILDVTLLVGVKTVTGTNLKMDVALLAPSTAAYGNKNLTTTNTIYRLPLGQVDMTEPQRNPLGAPLGHPWRPTGIASYDTSTSSFRLNSGLTVGTIRIDYVALEIRHCRERRIKFGALPIHSQVVGAAHVPGVSRAFSHIQQGNEVLANFIITFALARLTPGWDQIYINVAPCPLIVPGINLKLPWVMTDPLENFSNVEGVAYQLDGNGLPLDTGVSVPTLIAFTMHNNFLVSGSDRDFATSQPYTKLEARSTAATGANALQQELEAPAVAQTYTHVRFLAYPVSGSPPPLAVSIGGVNRATLTKAEWDAIDAGLGYNFKLIDKALSPTFSTPGTATVTFTGAGWEVLSASSFVTSNASNRAGSAPGTYASADSNFLTPGGTTTPHSLIVSAVEVTGSDAYVVLSTDAPQVTGFSTSVQTQSLPIVTGCVVDPGCLCTLAAAVTGLDYVNLAWTNAPITGVDYYEVQRMDCDTDWTTIVTVTGSPYADYGARIGVLTSYRVRVCRLDGICGAWSAIDSETLSVPSKPVLYFTTNEQPSLNVAYMDVGGERDYTFLDADEVEVVRLHDRDAQVVFRPPERRGVRFSRQLVLYSCPIHFRPSTDAFRPLTTIAEAALSSVTVRDTNGNRWTASLIVPEGTERIRTASHVVIGSVDVVEVSL